jgi:O-antigen ligase
VKWVALFIVLAAIMPLSVWLRRNPRFTPKLWMLFGILPFGLSFLHLYMAAISWADWPGYVKGAEFSVLDALALAIYFTLPAERSRMPFVFFMAAYFIAVVLSVAEARVPMASLFYPWQLARMFLVYTVVARATKDPRVAPALLAGMAMGLIMQAAISIWYRFGLNMLASGGTFESKNMLGLLSHFIVFPFFAMMLTGRSGRLPVIVVLAGLIVEFLTASRATIGLGAVGYSIVFFFSALKQWTRRKAIVMFIGAVCIAGLAPLAVASLEDRGTAALESSDEERVFLERAAAMMLSDYPFGIGTNHYVLVANVGGYNEAAGVAPVPGSDAANVHNVYWLVAVESGYLGLVTFVLMLLQPLIVAFRCGWRNRDDSRGDLLIGLGTGILMVYIHSFFEWIFVAYQTQYLFAMVIGLVAGLARQLGYWRT